MSLNQNQKGNSINGSSASKAKIIGHGLYVPGRPISNEELKGLAHIEFDAAKIERKLGMKYRHIAKLTGVNETTADFATRAAEEAIAKAGIDAKDINLFIVGTDTPEYISPSTALIVQGRIQKGETFAAALDIGASCASFTSAFDTASRMMAHDPTMKYAVVVGVYNMTRYIRDADVFGYSIFADGAGAVVLERVDVSDPSGYINGQFMADGTQWDYIGVYAGGTKNPITPAVLESGKYGLELIQPLPGDRNVRLWPIIVDHLLAKANMGRQDIDHIIFTQINKYVIEQVMAILEMPMEKTTCVMDRYGYTGSGCIPMAFYHGVEEGKIKRGDKVMFVASGAGFALCSNFFVY
jgi:3-oxoacyl-[acyl-carrier-protein] synthase-3